MLERYQLLLEAFLLGCGSSFRYELMKQDEAIGLFTALAASLQNAKPPEREAVFAADLKKLEFSGRISVNYF